MLNDDEYNKVFGFFLNQNGITPQFRKTKYGYRTYDSVWKLLKNKDQIVRHKTVSILCGREYEEKLEERIYKIVKLPKRINISFFLERLI
jgi:hypothetical protein